MPALGARPGVLALFTIREFVPSRPAEGRLLFLLTYVKG